jgi:hypothetical protein
MTKDRDHRLTLITYLRSLTGCLTRAKVEACAANLRLEDRDFLNDLQYSYTLENFKKVPTWQTLPEALRDCMNTNMSWPEVCHHFLRVLHVAATPQELIDDYKSRRQGDNVSDELYVRNMKLTYRELSGVLPKTDALLATAMNLRDSRVKNRLEKRIKSGEITHFSKLLDQVRELNEFYVGVSSSSLPMDRGKTELRPVAPSRALH